MKKEFRIGNLEKRNEWFNSLPVAEKRVEIAKDVLLSIMSGEFSPGEGYLCMRFRDEIAPNSNMQFLIEEKDKRVKCVGCGIAALFYSRIALGNGVLNDQYFECSDELDFEREEIHEKMKAVFSERQLEMVEVAYERDQCYAELIQYTIAQKCVDWADKKWKLFEEETKDERLKFIKDNGFRFAFKGLDVMENGYTYIKLRLMVAIMENIVKNKGSFRV